MLGGCATMVHSDVTAFHLWQAKDDFKDKTFWVLPVKDADATSLEFVTYAYYVGEWLKQYGLVKEAEATKLPDFVVWLGYGIDDGREYTFTYPVFGVTGGQTTNFNALVGNTRVTGTATTQPRVDVIGTRIGQATVYKRMVVIGIVERDPQHPQRSRVVYQGRAVSSGSNGEIAVVMPAIIDAVFKDFPGQSGKTKHVTTPIRN